MKDEIQSVIGSRLQCAAFSHLVTEEFASSLQAAWSFTGPPPGMAAQPQPVNFYQPYPPGGLVAMPPQPHMGIALHQTMPHMQPHPPPPHWMGAMAQPFPMNPVASVCPAAHHQMERKYVRATLVHLCPLILTFHCMNAGNNSCSPYLLATGILDTVHLSEMLCTRDYFYEYVSPTAGEQEGA